MVRRRWTASRWLLGVAILAGVSCGGGGDEAAPSAPTTTSPPTTFPTAPLATGPPPTTVPPPEGVETFEVSPAHSNDPIVYAQTPPVGGTHNPTWQTCTFYDHAVPSETAVHSLEHGAIWITYRPDVPADQLEVLARFARSRASVLVSRWDVGLPAPIVASSWGRQLKLESATDPRLVQFYQAFTGQAPEPSAPC